MKKRKGTMITISTTARPVVTTITARAELHEARQTLTAAVITCVRAKDAKGFLLKEFRGEDLKIKLDDIHFWSGAEHFNRTAQIENCLYCLDEGGCTLEITAHERVTEAPQLLDGEAEAFARSTDRRFLRVSEGIFADDRKVIEEVLNMVESYPRDLCVTMHQGTVTGPAALRFDTLYVLGDQMDHVVGKKDQAIPSHIERIVILAKQDAPAPTPEEAPEPESDDSTMIIFNTDGDVFIQGEPVPVTEAIELLQELAHQEIAATVTRRNGSAMTGRIAEEDGMIGILNSGTSFVVVRDGEQVIRRRVASIEILDPLPRQVLPNPQEMLEVAKAARKQEKRDRKAAKRARPIVVERDQEGVLNMPAAKAGAIIAKSAAKGRRAEATIKGWPNSRIKGPLENNVDYGCVTIKGDVGFGSVTEHDGTMCLPVTRLVIHKD